jgi:hypothetical protein
MYRFRHPAQSAICHWEYAQRILAVFLLSLTVLSGAAFSLGQANSQRVMTNPRAKSDKAPPSDGLSDLPGTDWSVLPYQTMPDILAFCRSGRWELQSNTPVGGRYQISGSRIVMTLDDGSTFADCRLSKREGDEIYLNCGSDSLHLKYHRRVDCK